MNASEISVSDSTNGCHVKEGHILGVKRSCTGEPVKIKRQPNENPRPSPTDQSVSTLANDTEGNNSAVSYNCYRSEDFTVLSQDEADRMKFPPGCPVIFSNGCFASKDDNTLARADTPITLRGSIKRVGYFRSNVPCTTDTGDSERNVELQDENNKRCYYEVKVSTGVITLSMQPYIMVQDSQKESARLLQYAPGCVVDVLPWKKSAAWKEQCVVLGSYYEQDNTSNGEESKNSSECRNGCYFYTVLEKTSTKKLTHYSIPPDRIRYHIVKKNDCCSDSENDTTLSQIIKRDEKAVSTEASYGNTSSDKVSTWTSKETTTENKKTDETKTEVDVKTELQTEAEAKEDGIVVDLYSGDNENDTTLSQIIKKNETAVSTEAGDSNTSSGKISITWISKQTTTENKKTDKTKTEFHVKTEPQTGAETKEEKIVVDLCSCDNENDATLSQIIKKDEKDVWAEASDSNTSSGKISTWISKEIKAENKKTDKTKTEDYVKTENRTEFREEKIVIDVTIKEDEMASATCSTTLKNEEEVQSEIELSSSATGCNVNREDEVLSGGVERPTVEHFKIPKKTVSPSKSPLINSFLHPPPADGTSFRKRPSVYESISGTVAKRMKVAKVGFDTEELIDEDVVLPPWANNRGIVNYILGGRVNGLKPIRRLLMEKYDCYIKLNCTDTAKLPYGNDLNGRQLVISIRNSNKNNVEKCIHEIEDIILQLTPAGAKPRMMYELATFNTYRRVHYDTIAFQRSPFDLNKWLFMDIVAKKCSTNMLARAPCPCKSYAFDEEFSYVFIHGSSLNEVRECKEHLIKGLGRKKC